MSWWMNQFLGFCDKLLFCFFEIHFLILMLIIIDTEITHMFIYLQFILDI